MIVKLITRIGGPGGNFSPGSVIDLENGKELVAGGYAISLEPIIEDEPKIKKPKKSDKTEPPKKAVKKK